MKPPPMKAYAIINGDDGEVLEYGNWHLEGHKIVPRRNGGTECDNPNGPCACGAWHENGR